MQQSVPLSGPDQEAFPAVPSLLRRFLDGGLPLVGGPGVLESEPWLAIFEWMPKDTRSVMVVFQGPGFLFTSLVHGDLDARLMGRLEVSRDRFVREAHKGDAGRKLPAWRLLHFHQATAFAEWFLENLESYAEVQASPQRHTY